MKLFLLTALTVLSFCVPLLAADYEYLCPLDDPNTPAVVCLPDVGKTCRLICPIRFHEDLPFSALEAPDISQTWVVSSDFQVPSPLPPVWGDFKIESYKQDVLEDGRGVIIEFEIPAKLTTITINTNQDLYRAFSRRKYSNQRRRYSIDIRPSIPWEVKLQTLGTQLAPGLHNDLKPGPG